MNYITPIVLLILFIISTVMAVLFFKKDVFIHIKTEQDCNTRDKLPKSCQDDPKCCAIWDEGTCVKGRFNGDVANPQCVHKPAPGALVSALCAVGFLVGFIVTLIMAIVKKD